MSECIKQKIPPKGYHFKECGLDYIYLVNGYEIEKDSDFGEKIVVHNSDKLHRAIARSVLLYKENLEGQEIRFFRSLLRLTQQKMSEILGVERETVSRWEKNSQAPSQSAEYLLRIIVWEKYLDKSKSFDFFQEHKSERKHYKIIEMSDKKDDWEASIAA